MIVFEENANATPLTCISTGGFKSWFDSQSERIQNFVTRAKFKGQANRFVEVIEPDGSVSEVFAGIGKTARLTSIGALPTSLPGSAYTLQSIDAEDPYELLMGWGLGSYKFTDYKKGVKPAATLHVNPVEFAPVQDEINAINLCRDLINTPASDMLPHHLEAAVRKVAVEHDATLNVTLDKDLLKRGFRTIYAVGKASASEPRLMDLTWGDESNPKLTLVGKGVCFDSGGLDLKSHAGMRSMKKDMGGAANVLGLADLIMRRKLPLRLRVLIPAVENAVSGNAYRPGDVVRTYKGLTVEIGNTDAEGRLIMCDAIALACEEQPELLIDFSTLTGAARSAVGTEIAAMFCNDDEVAEGIAKASVKVEDPVCRLPLYPGYRAGLNSQIADLCNIASFSEGGAITAALFLESFVKQTPWVHFDIMASNTKSRPAHPAGGEAMGLRATFRYIESRCRS